VNITCFLFLFPHTISGKTSGGFSLKKDDYKIVFSSPKLDSIPSICIFPDHPDFNTEDINIINNKCLENYVEFVGDSFTFRRKDIEDTTIIEKQNSKWIIYIKNLTNNFISVPISYETPDNYNSSIIAQMDQILSTYKNLN